MPRKKTIKREEASVASSFIKEEVPKGETIEITYHSHGTFNVMSVNEAAVYISDQQKIDGAASVVSPVIDVPIGGKLTTTGVWITKEIKNAKIEVEVSFNQKVWSKSVFSLSDLDLEKGLNIVVIDLEKIKAPFYRFNLKFNLPQTCFIEFQFCNK